jgi:hypothetical protein
MAWSAGTTAQGFVTVHCFDRAGVQIGNDLGLSSTANGRTTALAAAGTEIGRYQVKTRSVAGGDAKDTAFIKIRVVPFWSATLANAGAWAFGQVRVQRTVELGAAAHLVDSAGNSLSDAAVITGQGDAKGTLTDAAAPSANSNPSVYRAFGVVTRRELKQASAIGVTGSSDANGVLETHVPSTSTSVAIKQRFIAEDGTWKRKSTSESTWQASWKKLYDEDNKPSFSADITGTADWASQIAGSGKPADNATVGAVLGTNLKNGSGVTVTDNDALNAKAHEARGYNRQPAFQRWSGALPDNWSMTGSASATKQTASPRYGDWSLEVSYPASDNQYLWTSAAEVRVPPSADDYYVIDYEVELVSGDFNRAGVWWRVDYQNSSNYKHFTLDLTAEHPGATTGKVYAGAKVLGAGVTGSPTGLPGAASLYLMGNHSLMGDSVSAKVLRWHRVLVRKATREEIRASNGLDDNGDLTRDLTPARKLSSQIMTHAAGGTYTGDLTATNGATLGANLKDSAGSTVTDHDALNAKAFAAGGFNRNPSFQRWTGGAGSAPDNYAKSGGAAVTIAKQTSGNLYGAWAMRVANTASQSGNVSATQASGELRAAKDQDHVTFDWEVGLVAGDFVRAGIIYRLYFGGGTSTYKQFNVDFNVEHPSTTAGLYGDVKTAAVSSTVGTPSGAPTGAELFLVNADSALSGVTSTAKTIDWHRVAVRKPSKEEVRTVNLGALAAKNTVGSADIDAASATPTVIGPRRLNGLILDPNFADANYWQCTNGSQIVSSSAGTIALGVAAGFQAQSTSATASILQAIANRGDGIPCEPNATYQVKANTRVTFGFNGQVQLGLSYFQYDGTASAIKASEVIGGTDHTSSPAGAAVNEDLSLTFTTPADCDLIRVVARVSWGANYPGSHAGNGLIGRLRISASPAYNDSVLLAGANVYSGSNDYAQPPRPTSDNSVTLGTATRRWSQLFAGATTINTSDAREKTDISDVPQEVIDAIGALPARTFRFIDAVAEKGDGARWHYGFTAQAVAEAMTAAGQDPHAYGFYCEDVLCEAQPGMGADGRPCIVETPVLDDQDRPVTRLGLRLDYLFAIRLEADARRLADLEARIAALEG